MYITPADVEVSDNFQDHLNRNSVEPGTDYATAYGTDCRMPGDGVIVLVDNSPSGADGRRLEINMDNGEVIDMIHASHINAKNGQRVRKGQIGIFYSGASGHGKDWYYGSHVHVTRRTKVGKPFKDSSDFELALDREEDDMSFTEDDRQALNQVRQVLTEEKQWEGMDKRLYRVADIVEQLEKTIDKLVDKLTDATK